MSLFHHSQMVPYVFIGFNGLFGDYADIVRSRGGFIRKVVVNLPLDTRTGVHTFAEQLALYHAWLDAAGIAHRVEIEQLRDFRPSDDDHHVVAARGLRLQPLCAHVTSELGLKIEPLIHPSAAVSPSVRLPEGIIIRERAIVGSNAQLGRFCAIGSGAYVGHDVTLEPFADLAPGVHLASGVRVRFGARLSIHCTVINDITLGEQSRVAAGAVVTRDVDPLTLVVGVPAAPKRKLEPADVPKTVPGIP